MVKYYDGDLTVLKISITQENNGYAGQ